MKAKEKTESAGYWFDRDNRGGHHCGYPVATKNPKGFQIGEAGSKPRKTLRRRYATLVKSRLTTVPSFKAWLRAAT